MTELDRHQPALARLACGDIPTRYCNVVGVEISGDSAQVWQLTNDGPSFEAYQVSFSRKGGEWIDAGASGGFQTGTPEHITTRARWIAEGRAAGLSFG